MIVAVILISLAVAPFLFSQLVGKMNIPYAIPIPPPRRPISRLWLMGLILAISIPILIICSGSLGLLVPSGGVGTNNARCPLCGHECYLTHQGYRSGWDLIRCSDCGEVTGNRLGWWNTYKNAHSSPAKVQQPWYADFVNEEGK